MNLKQHIATRIKKANDQKNDDSLLINFKSYKNEILKSKEICMRKYRRR